MRSNKPQTGPVEAARGQLESLRDHILTQDLVSIPFDDRARVEESPPFARTNFAYISPPGPYEDRPEAVYYISPPDPNWSEEVQRDYLRGETSLLATSAHEVWPGHYLNILHAKATGRPFNQVFISLIFAEGWAHYTEELMVETGLRNGDPEVQVGQLAQALMRNVRFLCAIGMHTAGMIVSECEEMFRNQGFQDEGTARQQAARGTYDPLYLSYTLGKLMIRQLRDEWSRERGGRAAWKQFHDEFLSLGFPPIPLISEAMLSQ